MSYNFPDQMLDNLDYTTCIRQETGTVLTSLAKIYVTRVKSVSKLFLSPPGFCSVNYAEAPATGAVDNFELYGAIANMVGIDAEVIDQRYK